MGGGIRGAGVCVSVIVTTVWLLSNECGLITLRAGHVLSGKTPTSATAPGQRSGCNPEAGAKLS